VSSHHATYEKGGMGETKIAKIWARLEEIIHEAKASSHASLPFAESKPEQQPQANAEAKVEVEAAAVTVSVAVTAAAAAAVESGSGSGSGEAPKEGLADVPANGNAAPHVSINAKEADQDRTSVWGRLEEELEKARAATVAYAQEVAQLKKGIVAAVQQKHSLKEKIVQHLQMRLALAAQSKNLCEYIVKQLHTPITNSMSTQLRGLITKQRETAAALKQQKDTRIQAYE
jgi:hypothetical protein